MKNNTHKKISIPMKNNTHKKISIPMKNNSQTSQQNSIPIKNELTQFCLHIKLTINQKLSNNVQKSYPTQNLTNGQHCPNFAIPKNSTIQKCPKIKIKMTTQRFPSKSYNIQKFPQEQTTTYDNAAP